MPQFVSTYAYNLEHCDHRCKLLTVLFPTGSCSDLMLNNFVYFITSCNIRKKFKPCIMPFGDRFLCNFLKKTKRNSNGSGIYRFYLWLVQMGVEGLDRWISHSRKKERNGISRLTASISVMFIMWHGLFACVYFAIAWAAYL